MTSKTVWINEIDYKINTILPYNKSDKTRKKKSSKSLFFFIDLTVYLTV